jgi:putative ubiquitin-RnfH superfamily antitoxin RatB of RatAB toxin-antitoxin module
MAHAEALQVEVVYCPRPGVCDLVPLTLEAGATVADALRASGLLERHGLALQDLRAGVWCRPCEVAAPLRDRDRVEIYRPLQVDPKEARRQRYKRHRERTRAAPASGTPRK